MRPRASSTATCAGVQPERPPTEPEASSACKKAWAMNGLNRSPPASSIVRPGGLAQASHAAASMAAIDVTTRAVKVEDMGGQAFRSGTAHLSTQGTDFVVKGPKAPRAAYGLSRAATARSHWKLDLPRRILAQSPAVKQHRTRPRGPVAPARALGSRLLIGDPIQYRR
jgi:hypothetical protein